MPKKCCINNFHKTYMHFIRSEDTFEDINGKKYPRYRIYECECGQEHRFDVLNSIWF